MQVIGEDVSPGIKGGGRVNWIRRTIPCLARGDSIPRDFTVDIRSGQAGGSRPGPAPAAFAVAADALFAAAWAPQPPAYTPPCAPRLYCSKMELNDKLYFTDLAVPQGAVLHRVNAALPILKVAK